jgi:hypothetical protein
MLTKIVRKNRLSFAILLFLALFSLIHFLKPSLIYNDEGGFRPFGVGYRHKTVIPIWIVAIILAIFSYMFVLYAVDNI